MNTKDRFPLLRKILVALGLSEEAVDDIVERILDWLAGEKAAGDRATELPFHLRDDFLSPTELAFCRVLVSAVAGRLVVCPKVNLADLFFVESGDARSNRALLNRIDRKHVDFLLCDPATMRPRVAIELDDSSHQRPDRQRRDVLVDDVFAAAKLPLVRVRARGGYAVAEVESVLRPHLVGASVPPPPHPSTGSVPGGVKEKSSGGLSGSEAPACPKCGAPMVLRTAKSGANAGGSFWGCRNYPRCREILAVQKLGVDGRASEGSPVSGRDEDHIPTATEKAWAELNRPLPESPSDDSRYMPKG